MRRVGNTSYLQETEHAKRGGWGWQQLPGDTTCYKGGRGAGGMRAAALRYNMPRVGNTSYPQGLINLRYIQLVPVN